MENWGGYYELKRLRASFEVFVRSYGVKARDTISSRERGVLSQVLGTRMYQDMYKLRLFSKMQNFEN